MPLYIAFGLLLAAILCHFLYYRYNKRLFHILGFLFSIGAAVCFFLTYYPQTLTRNYGSIFENEEIRLRRLLDNIASGFISLLASVLSAWWLGWFISEKVFDHSPRQWHIRKEEQPQEWK